MRILWPYILFLVLLNSLWLLQPKKQIPLYRAFSANSRSSFFFLRAHAKCEHETRPQIALISAPTANDTNLPAITTIRAQSVSQTTFQIPSFVQPVASLRLLCVLLRLPLRYSRSWRNWSTRSIVPRTEENVEFSEVVEGFAANAGIRASGPDRAVVPQQVEAADSGLSAGETALEVEDVERVVDEVELQPIIFAIRACQGRRGVHLEQPRRQILVEQYIVAV